MRGRNNPDLQGVNVGSSYSASLTHFFSLP